MFKVSEVAEMLSVEKVKIFEALILHDTLLAPYVTKERHLSYISEVGVRKLEKILFSKNLDQALEIELEEEAPLETHEPQETPDKIDPLPQEKVVDQMDIFIEKTEEKKANLRNEIIELKRKISHLDKDIKMKSDSIDQFQNILSEDLKWTHDLMIKIELSMKEKEHVKQNFFSKMKR